MIYKNLRRGVLLRCFKIYLNKSKKWPQYWNACPLRYCSYFGTGIATKMLKFLSGWKQEIYIYLFIYFDILELHLEAFLTLKKDAAKKKKISWSDRTNIGHNGERDYI